MSSPLALQPRRSGASGRKMSESSEARSAFGFEFMEHLVIRPLTVRIVAQEESSVSPCSIFSWGLRPDQPTARHDGRELHARPVRVDRLY